MAEKKGQQADNKKSKKVDNKKTEVNQPKEIKLDLNELASKITQMAVMEVRKDLTNLAYRLYSLELSVYGLLNKGSVPNDMKDSIIQQEDILTSNVEVMLKRLKQLEEKQKEEFKKKQEEKDKPEEKPAEKSK